LDGLDAAPKICSDQRPISLGRDKIKQSLILFGCPADVTVFGHSRRYSLHGTPHLYFSSEAGVIAGTLAVISILDGEWKATTRMNATARQ
jgi:hypothetical protein